jgi:predicted phosphate transport protein (TIGR00153 family)
VARFRLIPREEKFYTDFLALADQIVSAADVLNGMLATETPDWEAALQIHDIEHECDGIAHTIIQRLNRTFVTPIDREDIHQLARSLDDVIDAIDAAATVIRRYRVAPVRYGARELAGIIIRSTHQVRMAVDALERKVGVHERAVEVNRLENEADRMHDEALRRLFEEERDPIAVIKWKEVLDFLEEATDRCEDVANVLEGVVVKHG